MRQMYWIPALLAVALLASACAQKAPPVDVAAEAQAIRDRSAAWLKAVQSRNVAGVASEYFAPDASTMYEGEIHHGTAEIQAGLDAEFAAMPELTLGWTTTDVRVAASGELAYEVGTLTFDPDGAGEAPELSGEFVTVWTKADGTWRVAADAGTLRKPKETAPEAAAPGTA